MHCKLLLRSATGKAASPFLPCFFLFFSASILSQNAKRSCFPLMMKTTLPADRDVMMLECCLPFSRSCESPAVCQSGLLLWNGCFPKGICDHLHVYKDKVSLGCFISYTKAISLICSSSFPPSLLNQVKRSFSLTCLVPSAWRIVEAAIPCLKPRSIVLLCLGLEDDNFCAVEFFRRPLDVLSSSTTSR